MGNTSRKKVIVYGPQGCGKTLAAEQLMRKFGCESLLDEWDGSTQIPPGHLALTCLEPPYEVEADVVVKYEAVA